MNKSGRVLFIIGVLILAILIFVAVFASVLAPYDPNEFGTPYQSPSSEHLLGTNDVGQDILSELIHGTRISLIIGITAAVIATVVGTMLGILSGYYGGALDKIITQITNVALALPSLVLSILLVSYLNANLWNIILAICITAWTQTARVVRTRVQQLKVLPFVQVENMMSASSPYIMTRHILPNVFDIVYARGILAVAGAMLTEAGLSFLGLGVTGQKSWGMILYYAYYRNGLINGYWWWYGPPIICITISVVGFMLIGHYTPAGRNKTKAYTESGQA